MHHINVSIGKQATLGKTKNKYGQLAVLHSYFVMETSQIDRGNDGSTDMQ